MLQSGLRQLAGSSGGVSNGVDGRLLSRTRSSSRASGRLDTLTCPAVAWNSDGAIEAIRGEIEQVGRDVDSLMAKLTVSIGVWSGVRRFDDDPRSCSRRRSTARSTRGGFGVVEITGERIDNRTMAPPVMTAWIAEKFGSAVLSAAGGRAFNQVLALIGMSGDRTDEVLHKLDQIDTKASEILLRVKEIQAELKTIENALALTKDELKAAITEGPIATARSDIQSHYGKRETAAAAKDVQQPQSSTADSLLEILDYARLKVPVNVNEFAANVEKFWKIRERVSQIASAMSEGIGSTSPLLNQWSQLLINRVHSRGPFTAQTLLQSYLMLEGWFQQALEPQFQGMALVIAAKCYDKPPDRWAGEVTVALRSWRGQLLPQADLFLTVAAERGEHQAARTESPRLCGERRHSAQIVPIAARSDGVGRRHA